jgi:hypothetical protein
MVPTFTVVRSTGEAPGSTPAASPWLSRASSRVSSMCGTGLWRVVIGVVDVVISGSSST